MTKLAINVRHLRKEFTLAQHKHSSLKQVFINVGNKNIIKHREVLKGIDLEIKQGEFFGIVGRNGSGKSTLLKILAGVYSPTHGEVNITGQLTPFIELGVGFNPELSGYDNVFLNGALLGFSRKDMRAMYDDIVEFAELAPFMDQKLKNYSSGMQVRLAFSIAIRAKSEILLIDEVLAVGDTNFQKKCIEVFEDLKREGRTVVFVSHSMEYVREFCDRVMVLSDGKVLYNGNTEKGIDVYNKLNSEDEEARTEALNKEKEKDSQRTGSGKVQIIEHKILNDHMKESITLETDKKFTVKLKIKAHKTVKNCAVGVMFRKNPQENLYGLNNYYHSELIDSVEAGGVLSITISDRMPLNPGTYFLSFSVAGMKGTGYEDFDNLNNIMKVNVIGPTAFWGIISAKPTITIGEVHD